LISRALHANFDRVAGEPLPERWVDLINHLNECEKAEQAQDQIERPLPTRRPVH
jgi:hypothetical protein